MNFEIISEEWVSNAEVKKILSERKELEVEQNRAKDHVKDFSKLSIEKADKLKASLTSLGISKLKLELIILIINILPKDTEELRAILSMSVIPFGDDELQKIFESVKPYL